MNGSNIHALLFSLQGELFGISVENVLRVINLEKLIKIPKAPAYIAGAINLEGNVIPVVDLARKIELGETEHDGRLKVIVLEIISDEDIVQVGVMINEVLDVINIESTKLLPPPLESMGFNTSTLMGMYKVKEDFYMILQANKIFENELAMLVQ